MFHVQRIGGVGGSERHLLTLLPALKDLGVEIRLGVFATGQHRRFADLADAAGVDTVVIEQRTHVDPRSLRRLAGLIREFEPDLLHTHLIHASFYGSLLAGKMTLPHVATVHGRYPQMRGVGLVGVKFVSKSARRIIAISEYLAQFLGQCSSEARDKIEVIHYGIALPPEDSVQQLRNRFRREHHLTDHIVVGMASRIIQGKGHEQLISSFATAARDDHRLRLLIAGDGPLKEEMEGLARNRLRPESYRFFGHIAEIEPFIAALDILCFPTLPQLGEGFGLAALEAMAMGCPVLAADTSSLPEVVIHGSTGLLIPPGDDPSWAAALRHLAEDESLRLEMSSRARERAGTVFGLDTMAERTKTLYEKVIAS